MSEIIFKRLFEVRILHGYYLDNWFSNKSGKKGIFQEFGIDAPSRNEDQNFVLEYKYDILRDLIIEPAPETARFIRDARMRWRATSSGLIAGIEVRKDGSGNATRFFPKYSLPDDARWTFFLRARNKAFLSFTNHAQRPTLPAAYYFTNLIPAGEDKTYPSLSRHLPLFSSISNRTWEMGELTRSGNQVRAAKLTTDKGTEFTQVFDFNTDWYHFAHSYDRKVLPKSFLYRLDPVSGVVNTAQFILKDPNGNQVKEIVQAFAPAAPAPQEIPLSFTHRAIPPTASESERLHPEPIPDGWYDLVVRINNAAFESRRVWLRSDLGSLPSLVGLIDISSQADAPLYNLFNNDGSLNVKEISASEPQRWQGPVFEIRLLSRLAYWQYRLSKPLGALPANSGFEFVGDNRTIRTLGPHRFTSLRSALTLKMPGADIFLPTPEPASLKYDFAQKKYYTETFLSTL